MAAIRKKISWMERMVIPDIAKWSVSRIFTAIFLGSFRVRLLFKIISIIFPAAFSQISTTSVHYSMFTLGKCVFLSRGFIYMRVDFLFSESTKLENGNFKNNFHMKHFSDLRVENFSFFILPQPESDSSKINLY